MTQTHYMRIAGALVGLSLAMSGIAQAERPMAARSDHSASRSQETHAHSDSRRGGDNRSNRQDYREARGHARAEQRGDHSDRGSRGQSHGQQNYSNRSDYRPGYRNGHGDNYRNGHGSSYGNGHDNNYRNSHGSRYGYSHHDGNSYRPNRYDRYRSPWQYRHPHGYAYRNYYSGYYLPRPYFASSYYVDYNRYALRAPPRGYYWVRVDGDVVLAAIATGLIVDVVQDLFY